MAVRTEGQLEDRLKAAHQGLVRASVQVNEMLSARKVSRARLRSALEMARAALRDMEALESAL